MPSRRLTGTNRFGLGLALLIGIGVLLAACLPSGAGDSAEARRVLVSGSTTVAPVLDELADRYNDRQDRIQVNVQTGGSAAGVNDVARGRADIGMVSAPLYEGVDGVEPHPIARDGVAPVVHADSPVTVDSFTREQLRTIYTGGPAEGPWPGLAPGQSYVVVGKAAGRGTRKTFQAYLGLDPERHVVDVEIGDNAQGIQVVSQEPSAIAYLSIGIVELAVEDGRPLRTLGVEGVPATTETVANGTFPITRELELVTGTDPDQAILDFIEYVRSREHADVYQRFGFAQVSQ